MVKNLKMFISYAYEDALLCRNLEKHLILLQRQGFITTWHDRNISAGSEWDREITAHLATADIILLLISANFLASDYCYGIEMRQAMIQHECGETTVVPIILRPVYWQDAPFGKLQSLPTDACPVTSWHNQDEAFLNIVEGIKKIFFQENDLL